MSKKYPGLYLYFDWLRGLENVPSETAMEFINNLWHYAEERRPSIPLSDPPLRDRSVLVHGADEALHP